MGDDHLCGFDSLDSLLDSIYNLTIMGMMDVEDGEGQFHGSYDTISEEELTNLGFYEPQIDEIEIGKNKGLDVRTYAKDCYNWKQMHELRLGLEQNLDVREYKNPLFSAGQMREIRRGLMDRLDVSRYADLMYSQSDMNRIRTQLLTEAYARHTDGYGQELMDELTGLKVTISDDYLTAYIFQGKTKHTWKNVEVEAALSRMGIQGDILIENVAKLNDLDNEEPVAIATGKAACNGRDGWFEYFFDKDEESKPMELEDGTVDYSNFHTGALVKKGQLLVQYHPAEHGIDGYTVTGIPIIGFDGRNLKPLVCQNVSYNQVSERYLSERSGMAHYSPNTRILRVSENYVIQGNANYYNSHVDVMGDVHVMGNLEDGASIIADGSVRIEGFMGKGTIRAGQDVVVVGGVNGRGSYIEAGGNVYGRFFEGVEIKAGGDVEGDYFQNCSIKTFGSIFAKGNKSRILGGDIMAARSICATYIMQTNSKMLVSVGDMSWLQKVLFAYRGEMEQTKELVRQLEEARNKMLKENDMELLQENESYKKLGEVIHRKKTELSRLPGQVAHIEGVIESAKDCSIVVAEKIQDGIVMSIGGNKFVLPKPMGRCKLKTEDAEKFRLIMEAQAEQLKKKR